MASETKKRRMLVVATAAASPPPPRSSFEDIIKYCAERARKGLEKYQDCLRNRERGR